MTFEDVAPRHFMLCLNVCTKRYTSPFLAERYGTGFVRYVQFHYPLETVKTHLNRTVHHYQSLQALEDCELQRLALIL